MHSLLKFYCQIYAGSSIIVFRGVDWSMLFFIAMNHSVNRYLCTVRLGLLHFVIKGSCDINKQSYKPIVVYHY